MLVASNVVSLQGAKGTGFELYSFIWSVYCGVLNSSAYDSSFNEAQIIENQVQTREIA